MLPGEAKILQRIRKGDKEAFGTLYDFYVSNIFRFAFLKTGDKELAQDITSETFIKFWKYITANDIKRDTAEPVLYKIARNLIIDFYRKKEIVTESLDDYNVDFVVESNDFLQRLINKEEVEEMMQSLKQIKDEYQEIIILRFVEDFTIEEISEITGKTTNSVRVISHRAIKALRNAMKFRGSGKI